METPRQSISQQGGALSNPPSTRTSLDSHARTSVSGPRRNRAALRDYYGLKGQQLIGESSRGSSVEPHSREGGASPSVGDNEDTAGESRGGRLRALDAPNFDAGAHIKTILEGENLGGLLAMENELLGNIKTLDGERKALVYDNYSKLIAATDTIKKMRTHMDPLTPATETLDPTISHIAKTATELAGPLNSVGAEGMTTKANLKDVKKVQWVTDTPNRLQRHFAAGRDDAALHEWDVVQKTLKGWGMPKGSQELLDKCNEIVEKNRKMVVGDEDDESESLENSEEHDAEEQDEV